MHGQKRTQMNWTLINHFKSPEFDSPDIPGSGEQMNATTVEMLDEAREYANIPFTITSGVRSEAHNAKVGGKNGSAHLTGHAFDIAVRSGIERYIIITALLYAGFTRIGVSKGFIHGDNDESKPQNVIWTY